MSAAIDNEILDAFLVEAGELLDALGDQLIALESTPGDSELLNSVFRAFHTVKGGAGFISVRPMVEICHRAEELLNEARNHVLTLQPDHIDHLLQVLDVVQNMMQALRSNTPVDEAPPELLQYLQNAIAGKSAPAAAPEPVTPPPAPPPHDPVEAAFLAMTSADQVVDDSISDDEFERLLDELHGDKAPGSEAPASNNDAINDDEFEALLDSIYGKSGAPGKEESPPAPVTPPVAAPPPVPATVPSPPATSANKPPATVSAETQAQRADTTVRVDTQRIDALVNAAGELILVRNRLTNLTAHGADSELERAVNNLDRVASDMQLAVLRMRMQPIGRLFQRFPRIVRDLARKLGKQIELVQLGEDTNLDRTLVESLADPLIHLLRNAVDHGLEDPETRTRNGKDAQGTVTLAASQQGERVVISISDDGRGMNPDILRRKAVEKGLLDAEQAERLTESECYNLILRPGFSTSDQISDVSGRGVGMDVVKTNVAALGGTIDIESTLGSGSTIRIGIPLTLAILRVLMVRVENRLLALPLSNVIEVFEMDHSQLQRLDGRVVVRHRGRPLPLSDLRLWSGLSPDPKATTHVAVIHVGHHQLGLVASEVLGREEVMIKPLGVHLRHLSGLAGATITGDGRIALVLDLLALAESPLPPPIT